MDEWQRWFIESLENPDVKFIAIERDGDELLMRRFTRIPHMDFTKEKGQTHGNAD